jgi:outer membrane protein OmpA-like peptidoglycan-associated protein
MTCQKKHIITTVVLSILLSACSMLEKNQALEEAEKTYTKARQNKLILRYASADLERASQALERAAASETDEDMTSLAYVGVTWTKIAHTVAERKAATARLEELVKSKDREQRKAQRVDKKHEQQRQAQAFRAQEAALLKQENAMADNEALRRELKELQAMKTERGMVITLGDVLFSFGKTNLLPGAMNTIDRLAKFLSDNPKKSVLIEGHTDNVGAASYNLNLSKKRALAVKDALIRVGVDASRIATLGLGETSPITDNTTEVGRMKNRRVEVVIRD